MSHLNKQRLHQYIGTLFLALALASSGFVVRASSPQATQAQAQTQFDHAKLQSDAVHQQLKLQGETQFAQRKAELEAQLMLVEAGLRERADHRAQALHVLDMQHRRERHLLEMGKAGIAPTSMTNRASAPDGGKCGCDSDHCSCNSNQSGNHPEVTTNEPSCSCQP